MPKVVYVTFEESLHQYKDIYYKFPQSLKTFLGTLYGNIPLSIRFGKKYSLHTKILKQFEESDEQFKLDYMYNKTLETLIFAEENIPYYKNIFLQNNISSKDLKSLDDLKKFPTLTKNNIKVNLESIHTNIIEKPVAYYSGGSLSTPTKFFLPVSSRAKEKAYDFYYLSKIGYRYRDKTILLKGREVSKPEKNIFWEYEPVDNYFLLSNNYMNSDAFPLMYEKVLKFQAKFLFGYPSAVLSFIKQSQKYGYKKIKIEGVMLSSETIYSDELQLIRDYFGVNVLCDYGHTERSVFGYRVNQESYYFLNAYGAVRIIDEEIVTTTFDNFVMPFVNYKTGDHATGKAEYYKNCDIAKSVENIEGRTQDYLVTKDKRLISITTMCGGQHLPLEQINAIQYIQKDAGRVTVLVEGDKDLDINAVNRGMQKLVREGIDFETRIVDHIEKSSRGKRIICKQALNIEEIRLKYQQ